MKIISVQEAFKRKFARQRKIKELEYHAWGHCVHIGKISLGCFHCFAKDKFYVNITAGMKCNLNCSYCTSDKEAPEITKDEIKQFRHALEEQASIPGYAPSSFSFTGGGEPLVYIDFVEDGMKTLHSLTSKLLKKPWFYLYTNGLLADNEMLKKLQDMGFDEIRFHIGASNFSKKVYDNMRKAVNYFKAVTVETPLWPPAKKNLFEMLPIIEDMGVRHLNLGELEILNTNYEIIDRILPEAEIYHSYEMHLYDNGLVYDIMKEVIEKQYSYSVLDCSSLVKSYQRGKSKWVDIQSSDDIEGLFETY